LSRCGLRQSDHKAQDSQACDEPVTGGSVDDVFTHAIILSHLPRSSPSRTRATATRGMGYIDWMTTLPGENEAISGFS
jgi:hypothetical protein